MEKYLEGHLQTSIHIEPNAFSRTEKKYLFVYVYTFKILFTCVFLENVCLYENDFVG